MNAIAWSQNLTAEKAAAQGVTAVSKEALFREADFITIHLRLSDRSRGLVNAEMLALMKPDAWIVNTSRGPIIAEAALLEVLKAKRLGGAALDVFDHKPLQTDPPLPRLDNGVTAPHVSSVHHEKQSQFYRPTPPHQ